MNMKTLHKYTFLATALAAIVWLQAGTSLAADVTVTATVNPTTVAQNQQFVLTVEVAGKNATRAERPELPNIDAFAAYSGSSSSQSIQIINGVMSQTVTYSYYYLAREPGTHTIPAITVKLGNDTFQSQPAQIEIVQRGAGAAPPPASGSGSARSNGDELGNLADNLYLKAHINKRRVYQSEPVIVEYKIYTRVQVINYAPTGQPNYGDFWAEEFEVQPVVRNEMIDGQAFRVATLKKVALFPTSAGKKTIPGQEMEVSVRVRERRQRRDFFDSFFDDPFLGRTITQRIASRPVDIEVLPLPQEGRPAGFTGAVGDYRISASVDRSSAKTNEAITLKIVLAGSGNIKMMALPPIKFPDQFEVYDPKINEKITREDNRISGSKTFEYLLIPRRAGQFELPPVRFAYFDPAAGSYRTIATDKITLRIDQGEQTASNIGSGFSKEEVRLLGQDIRHIQKTASSFHARNRAFYHAPLFWAGLLAPLLVLLTGVYFRSQQERMSSNVAYARSRKAQKLAQRQLKKARLSMDGGDVANFYAEAARALTTFAGNKLNVDEAALVTEELVARLRERRLDEALVQEFQALLAECDFRRFAMPDAPGAAMQASYERIRKLLVELERRL